MQANTDRLHAQVEMTGSPKPPSMTAYGSCKLRYPDRLTSWHCVRVRRIRSESIILSAGTFRRLKPCPKLPKRHAHSSSSSYLRLPIPLLIVQIRRMICTMEQMMPGSSGSHFQTARHRQLCLLFVGVFCILKHPASLLLHTGSYYS